MWGDEQSRLSESIIAAHPYRRQPSLMLCHLPHLITPVVSASPTLKLLDAALQLGKQAKAAADAQHAQATRDRALLDAATSQRVAEADTRRYVPGARHRFCTTEHQ